MTKSSSQTLPKFIDRRALLTGSVGAGAGLGAVALSAQPSEAAASHAPASQHVTASLSQNSSKDQTARIQAAIDSAAKKNVGVSLPSGRFVCGPLSLPSGTQLSGAGPLTTLVFSGRGHFITINDGINVTVSNITLDGTNAAQTLIHATHCRDLVIKTIVGLNASKDTVHLQRCAGRVSTCTISASANSGIFANDSTGLSITDNSITACANNGIVVFRSNPGEDRTIISHNRISHISARAGGSGQNGNGINVYRADSVMISNNQITDCAYSAVRANSASNVQILANTCQRIGEVALYAEFAFEGAVIANNLVDTAACGISVTNFNEGGRLAVVQGNLVRNLFRREHEPVDKRGTGISVEADAAISGNTIENAPTEALAIGWGPYMRDVAATGNVIRNSRAGILISADQAAGACLIANNMISGAPGNAIRAMNKDGLPFGPDLSKDTTQTARISISGNLAV